MVLLRIQNKNQATSDFVHPIEVFVPAIIFADLHIVARLREPSGKLPVAFQDRNRGTRPARCFEPPNRHISFGTAPVARQQPVGKITVNGVVGIAEIEGRGQSQKIPFKAAQWMASRMNLTVLLFVLGRDLKRICFNSARNRVIRISGLASDRRLPRAVPE